MTARPPWAILGGFFLPSISRYSPPMIRHLCAILRPAGGIFAPMSDRAKHPKKQNPCKGHLQAIHGILSPGSIPHIPSTSNSTQWPTERLTRHRATPTRSARSRPGYCHFFRAMESTAQRSFSASHQAQREPLHWTASRSTTASPLDAPRATIRATSNSGHSRWSFWVSSIVATPPPQPTRRSVPQAAFGR